jgi:hypothetical protein
VAVGAHPDHADGEAEEGQGVKGSQTTVHRTTDEKMKKGEGNNHGFQDYTDGE